MSYVRHFKTVSLADIAQVGGKNASLGHMIQHLSLSGIKVPTGFAITVKAYRQHLEQNDLFVVIQKMLAPLTLTSSLSEVQFVGKKIRTFIEKAPLDAAIIAAITNAYQDLCNEVGSKACIVAVRSSATIEDSPDASCAGQQESFLYRQGIDQVIAAYKKSIASLFTDRAIIYRNQKGIDHLSIGISVGVQQMVHAEKACSGIMFTVDPESGFKDVIVISSSYGVGESLVKGEVVPDEFHVFKKTLHTGHDAIIKKSCGSKKIKRIFSKKGSGTIKSAVALADRLQFSLTHDQIHGLARIAQQIEDHYTVIFGTKTYMDIEWAQDAHDGCFYIVQARPETIHTQKTKEATSFQKYRIKTNQTLKILVEGQSVGQKIVSGKARIIKTLDACKYIEEGEILVTHMTDPDWVSLMKKSGAIITESGGRTCHAAIVSRELGIPALVGASGALKKITDGQMITLDCSASLQGTVYEGILNIETEEIKVDHEVQAPVKVLLNIATPEHAYTHSFLPVSGVGLARLEFIITNMIGIHPMVLAAPERIKDQKIMQVVAKKTLGYASLQDFFIKKIAEGIGLIAAAFFPRPVLVRFSDFKSNEYRGLLGGSLCEPVEENPMMGLRGASRYYHALYAPAFALECQAIVYARQMMGLHNINVMVPFVRTVQEAQKVTELLKTHGLVSGRNGLAVYMMCEIPSNVLLIEKFAHYFDGFSIGSNDLTQTTLSVDRDSGLLASVFDERDEAVMKMLSLAIHGAHFAGKPIGICGQAPSDKREIAEFIMQEGIDSVSLNADSVLPFLRDFGSKKEVAKKRKDTIVPAVAA